MRAAMSVAMRFPMVTWGFAEHRVQDGVHLRHVATRPEQPSADGGQHDAGDEQPATQNESRTELNTGNAENHEHRVRFQDVTRRMRNALQPPFAHVTEDCMSTEAFGTTTTSFQTQINQDSYSVRLQASFLVRRLNKKTYGLFGFEMQTTKNMAITPSAM
mmetsp:Transcript_13507/g.27729  ORF Transcript_13507/g.27729 Transcript_13507/m.27729 type:complete len:160 (+) Transcript_13507:148-627(+)